jgi:hypothetical protein
MRKEGGTNTTIIIIIMSLGERGIPLQEGNRLTIRIDHLYWEQRKFVLKFPFTFRKYIGGHLLEKRLRYCYCFNFVLQAP